MDHKEFWKQVREYERNGLRRGLAIYEVAYELSADITSEVVEMAGDPHYEENENLFYFEFSQTYELREAFGFLNEPIANFKKGIVSDPIDLEQSEARTKR